MLILTRKEGQVVCIGNDVKITVLGIKSGQIRIGVDAPRDVAVHREEVKARIDAGIEVNKATGAATHG